MQKSVKVDVHVARQILTLLEQYNRLISEDFDKKAMEHSLEYLRVKLKALEVRESYSNMLRTQEMNDEEKELLARCDYLEQKRRLKQDKINTGISE